MAGAKEIAGASQRQIFFCNFKTVGGFTQRLQTGNGLLVAVAGGEDAIAFCFAATHTTPQLMQLGKAETVGIFNDH